ncbi:MAG: C_GCAxxG_C_C family protein [Anaerolineae bacterium]|nr:C_GCAxxG_C_C family protein [Anaerolineae bacterium]
MNRSEKALAYFSEGFSCSQAVLTAFAEDFGLEHELALRVAGAFGGGMGRSAQTCGAATGALMALGLKYGKTQAEDNAKREKCYALAAEFLQKFRAQNDGLSCPELLGFDIGTPEGRIQAQQTQRSATLCPNLVRSAVVLMEQILESADASRSSGD